MDGQQRSIRLADRMTAFRESEIRMMFDKAEQQSGDLVRLEIGEPDFDTPSHIIEAASQAAHDGETHYTHNAGIIELREAIARKLQRENGVTADPESEIAVTTGGMEAIQFAMMSTVNPGESVIVPTPGWPNYFTIARMLDIEPIEVPLPTDREFALAPDRIEEAMDDSTRAIVLPSPANPTGRVFDTEAVRSVVDIAVEHDAIVIADEVYEKLTYDSDSRGILSATDAPDSVISVNSFSKSYAMTGWRVGWMVGPPPIVDAARQLHQGTTTCAPSISQHAGLAALEGPQEPIEEMKRAFEQRRDYLVERIEDIPHISCVPPEGGFYAFLDVRELDGTSLDIATRLLEEYGVVTVPGSGFGEIGEGYLRLSFANSMDRLELGFDRIEEMVRSELDT